MSSAIWWVRRDLRIGDNQALKATMQAAEAVIPVYILDPKLLGSAYSSPRRVEFMLRGLHLLDQDLRRRGSRLIVRQGEPLQELAKLREESGAGNIFAEADVSPYARRRDEKVSREIPLVLVGGHTIHPPESLRKADGTPYTVFTPFSRMWHSLPKPSKPIVAPERLSTPPELASLEIPGIVHRPGTGLFPAGETEAQRRLDRFIQDRIGNYAEDRNRMDLEGTSALSPYLRSGMLSARQAAWEAWEAIALTGDKTTRLGAETWLNELVWREFYASILYHFPLVRRTAFRVAMRNIQWRDDAEGFSAWSEGCTGIPVVDAGMRQLNTTGWMHNRARMIAASFLCKDLLIDWRKGEQTFMQQLLDGDPASNNGGWQWTAGTGTDAAPYFRVFNPVLQGRKFDPGGAYVRRWVPELQSVPDRYVHAPWEMPTDVQAQAGCVIGKDYPAPIVEHAMARQRALAAYDKG